MKKYLLFLFLLLILQISLFAQSPYTLDWKKEVGLTSVGVGTIVTGYYLKNRTPFFTTDELLSLDPLDINKLDRYATGRYSSTADHFSDITLLTSQLAPALLLFGQDTRSNFGQIMIMYGEAAAINLGVTFMTKSLFKRPRPYVFNAEVVEEDKLNKSAKSSFLSGHTSMTAVNTFFAAKVFSDFYPDSKWKPVVWGAAIAIPAVTGFLRVEAGKHYPTDVMAGYALGATIGVLVPHLCRNKNLAAKGVNIDMGFNSARLTWKFNKPKQMALSQVSQIY